MTDKQMQIYEESFIESFTEPQSNGSSLNFNQILEKNKKLNQEAEDKWSNEFYRGLRREILTNY